MIKSSISIKGKVNSVTNLNGETNASIIVPKLEEIEVIPTVVQQELVSEKDGFKKVTIAGDENLKSENIKSGVSIFGIEGNITGLSLLPNNYQQLESIANSGTQYINTGINPLKNAYSCAISFRLKEVYIANKETWIFGQYGTSNGWRCGGKTDINSRVVNDRNNGFSYSSSTGNESTYYTLTENTVAFSALSTLETDYPMLLFAQQEGGTARYLDTASYSLYWCKIWYLGNLVRDFVPCYRKEDGEVGLYDTVNDEFYKNEGTGQFIKGSEVGGGLPYIRLEYIESYDNKQYIDTNVQALSTISVELKVLTPNNNECMFLGAWGNSNGLLFGQAGSHWFGEECYAIATDSAWKNAPGIKFDASWHTYKYDAITGKSSVDNIETEAPANSGRNANIFIFKTNDYGTCEPGTRISTCKIYDGEKLIRNYIPTKRKEDGVICMYDLVNEKFALPINGEFIAGPEVL